MGRLAEYHLQQTFARRQHSFEAEVNYVLLLHSGMSGEGSYKFPYEKLMRAKWITAVRQKNLGITPHIAMLCTVHSICIHLHYIRLLYDINYFCLKYVLPPIEFNSTTQLNALLSICQELIL